MSGHEFDFSYLSQESLDEKAISWLEGSLACLAWRINGLRQYPPTTQVMTDNALCQLDSVFESLDKVSLLGSSLPISTQRLVVEVIDNVWSMDVDINNIRDEFDKSVKFAGYAQANITQSKYDGLIHNLIFGDEGKAGSNRFCNLISEVSIDDYHQFDTELGLVIDYFSNKQNERLRLFYVMHLMVAMDRHHLFQKCLEIVQRMSLDVQTELADMCVGDWIMDDILQFETQELAKKWYRQVIRANIDRNT